MSTNAIIGIIVAVAVIGGGAYFLTQGKHSHDGHKDGEHMMEDGKMMEGDKMMEKDIPSNFSGTANELLALGQNIKCDFVQNEEGISGQGTVFIAAAGERIRMNYTAVAQGSTITGSAIIKDGTNYAWGSSPFGDFATKINLDESDDSSGDSEGFSPDDRVEFECERWTVDNGLFEPPAGVNFVEIGEQVQQINQNFDNAQQAQCSACDQIPDSNAAAQCRAALGC